MTRGLDFWRRSSRSRPLHAQAGRRRSFCRLGLESLEDRRLLATVAPLTGPQSDFTIDAGQHRGSSLIVQFREGTSSAGSLGAYVATANVNPEWALTPGMRRVDLDPAADWSATLASFQSDPNVLFAEPDYHVSLQLEPNDPSFSSTWGLNDTGQTGGTDDADIDAPEAWDVTPGSHDTIVAVIDTGVDYTHPDLAANIWTNPGEIPGNGKDDDHNGYVDDIHGYNFVNHDGDPMDDHFHGTHVAGTIGAVGDNDIGVAGVNWHVQIMALKFLDASGGGYESDAIAALNYAVANGAVVSNNSWGGGGFSLAFQTAIQNAAAKGHIFVAAAGNDGWNNDLDPFYPAGYDVPNVVSVAAIDHNDQLAWFSNYGTKSVDLAAPGVDIYSTFPTHLTQAMQDDGLGPNYGMISGTSMATPHVTGVMALVYPQVRAQHPEWSDQEVMGQVIDQVLGTVDVVDGALKTISGGRLNAAGAVGNPPADTTGPRVISTDPGSSGSVTGTVDHVRLRFSEPIDPATFDATDVVSMTGPGDPITDFQVVPVAGSSRQFDVTFAPQTALGVYSLVVGPNISDLTGNLLDQDRDGAGGEDPDDLVTASFEIADTLGFDSPDVPKSIDNLDSLFGLYTESILTVGQDITISDLNVQLNISFPYDGDLEIILVSPRGTQVTLSSFNGGDSADFADTIFDDQGGTPISFGFAPFFGTYRPEESLSQFDGEGAQGNWTLRVSADFNIDHFLDGQGYLNAWSLQIEGGGGGGPPPPPPPPPPGNRPPVAVDDALQVEVNTPMSIAAAELLANDTDPDGDPLSISFVGSPVGGAVSLGQRTRDESLVRAPDFVGEASFQYIVSDGFAMAIGNVSVTVTPVFQWHNDTVAEDVNHDGQVAANDALEIINVINAFGSTPIVFLSYGGIPNNYLDVMPDNVIAPSDALEVINYINAHSSNPRSTSVAATDNQSAAADLALLGLISSTVGDKKRV